MSQASNPAVLDLFCGAGGLSLGFAQAGFHVPYAVDSWDVACETHKLNHPDSSAVCGDIAELSGPELRRRFPETAIVIGGPPCQGFSTAGKQLLDDPRNRLVEEFIRAVAELRPQVIVLENVEGLVRRASGQLAAEIAVRFEKLGYHVEYKVLSATDFGVPQKRRRFILIGSTVGAPQFPVETHSFRQQVAMSEGDPQVTPTFWDAVSDLPLVSAGSESDVYSCPPENAFQRQMRQKCRRLTLHRAPNHRAHMVELMALIPQGKSAFDLKGEIPEHLMPKTGFPNSYARIRSDEPGPTITRNFTTPSSANCIHPFVDRALTLREGARLQTFPDNYQFAGTFGDQRLQIGNAVPPKLASAVATGVAQTLGLWESTQPISA